MKDYKEAIESIMKDTTSKVMDHAIKAYRQGYEDGQKVMIHDHEVAEEKAYNRGLNEAWEAAKKIHDGQIPYEVFGLDKIGNGFSYASPLNCGETITAQEAIAKIKEYEDKQDAEIKVGDEVIVQVDRIGFVTGFDVFDRVYVTTKDGWSDAFGRSFVKKTGRHFDVIPEVLKQMNREEDK